MVSSQPERFLLLEGVDSATQKALESDDGEFYGYDLSETFKENLDNDPRENFSEDKDDEENDPNSFQYTLESRVKDVTSGKVRKEALWEYWFQLATSCMNP